MSLSNISNKLPTSYQLTRSTSTSLRSSVRIDDGMCIDKMSAVFEKMDFNDRCRTILNGSSLLSSNNASKGEGIDSRSAAQKPWAELSAAERIELAVMGTVFGLPYAAFKGSKYALEVSFEKLSMLMAHIPVVLKEIKEAFDQLLSLIVNSVIDAKDFIIQKVANFYKWTKIEIESFLEIAAKVLKDAGLWLYQNILTPIGQFIETTFNKIAEAAKEIIEKLGILIKDGAIWSYENVLRPLGHLLETTFKLAVDGLDKAFQALRKGFKIIGAHANDGMMWVCKNILKPLENFLNEVSTVISKVVTKTFIMLWNGIEALGTLVKDAAKWSYENILTPLGHFLETAFTLISKGVTRSLEVFEQGLQILGTLIKESALWGYDHIFTPIGHFIRDSFNLSLNLTSQLLSQIYSAMAFMSGGIKDMSLWTYDHVLSPLGQFSLSVLNAVMDAGSKAMDAISSSLQVIGERIQKGALWGYDNILTPLGHHISAVFIHIANAMMALGEKIAQMGSLGLGYIAAFANEVIQKGSEAANSLNDYVIQPIYSKASQSASLVYESTVLPIANKTDYFVREYIPTMVDNSMKAGADAAQRVQDSAWRAIDYFSELVA